MTTLLIADEEPLPRLAARVILERQPGLTVVGEADTGSERVRTASAPQPDIVLIAAVHAVARGDAVIAPSLTHRLLDTFAHRLDVSSILARIGARTRDQVVAFASEAGLVRAGTDWPWPT